MQAGYRKDMDNPGLLIVGIFAPVNAFNNAQQHPQHDRRIIRRQNLFYQVLAMEAIGIYQPLDITGPGPDLKIFFILDREKIIDAILFQIAAIVKFPRVAGLGRRLQGPLQPHFIALLHSSREIAVNFDMAAISGFAVSSQGKISFLTIMAGIVFNYTIDLQLIQHRQVSRRRRG